MSDVALAAHMVARVYRSLDIALDMTPRRLVAVLELEQSARGRELSDTLAVTRIATMGAKTDVDRAMKDLTDGRD